MYYQNGSEWPKMHFKHNFLKCKTPPTLSWNFSTFYDYFFYISDFVYCHRTVSISFTSVLIEYLQEWVWPEPHPASRSSDWPHWCASRWLQWPWPGGASSAETHWGENEENIRLHKNLSRGPLLSWHPSLPRNIDSHLYHWEVFTLLIVDYLAIDTNLAT